MEAILESMGLSTLLERFVEENIEPETVLSLSENALIRLGVSTMGDRVRLLVLCRSAKDRTAGTSPSASAATPARQQVREERTLLFQPYRSHPRHRGSGRPIHSLAEKNKSSESKRSWTGQFVCLSDRNASRAPTSSEKQILKKAGLGLKKIKLLASDNEEDVLKKLTSDVLNERRQPSGFSLLKNCGGFEILQCLANSRDLEVVDTS